ncbi:MAG: 3-phosphoshikimate 1-carboxyvinyltransferase [Muribaculum sp.]|nr:3-phosphoshikimate 1-carboxyvinyltransferase [Muribaculum sp.]
MEYVEIQLPGSKSIAARALVCRLLSGHDTRIDNLPHCGDTDGMLRLTDGVRQAEKTGNPIRIDIGEGGTTLRFGMAACASIPGLDITLIGSRRLMARPHTTLIESLEAMGAEITVIPEENGIHIRGKELTGGDIRLDGSVSSQYLSALMLAAPTWKNDTVIRIKKPVVSYPYIRMTMGVMKAFGAHLEMREQPDYLEVTVKAHGYAQCARYDIEGDWSAASYFYEANLILIENLEFRIENQLRDTTTTSTTSTTPTTATTTKTATTLKTLKAPTESLQGDSRVAAIFAEATRRLKEGDESEMLMNLNDAPDLVPAIAVGFCVAGVPFRIEGIAHLRHKESDRMAALQTELKRIGFVLTCGDDYMQWHGERCSAEDHPLIHTYQDHRMAMAFAPAKIIYPNLEIENPEVVEKSFPNFWEEIAKVMHNARCTMHNHHESEEIQNSKFKIQN